MSANENLAEAEDKAGAMAERLRSQHGAGATEILSHLMRAARADLDRAALDHLVLVFRHLTRDGAGLPQPVNDGAGEVRTAAGTPG